MIYKTCCITLPLLTDKPVFIHVLFPIIWLYYQFIIFKYIANIMLCIYLSDCSGNCFNGSGMNTIMRIWYTMYCYRYKGCLTARIIMLFIILWQSYKIRIQIFNFHDHFLSYVVSWSAVLCEPLHILVQSYIRSNVL